MTGGTRLTDCPSSEGGPSGALGSDVEEGKAGGVGGRGKVHTTQAFFRGVKRGRGREVDEGKMNDKEEGLVNTCKGILMGK